jgi:hypothetical protein
VSQPVVHFEVICKDPARLRKYFGELFGWEFDVPSPVAREVSEPDSYGFLDLVTSEDGTGIRGGVGGGPASVGRCGAMNPPPGRSSPVSSKITTPLQSRLQPCSGWLTMVCAASRSGAEGAGQGGVCLQMPVPVGFIVCVFGWLACRSSCCDMTFSVNPGGAPAEMANPGKAHHQGRSHPCYAGNRLACFGAAGRQLRDAGRMDGRRIGA